MDKLDDKKAIRSLILLCAVTYFISYFTRLNYAAVMAEFISESGYSKAVAVLPITATSITYGAFQLISGYLGDRIKPRHIITGGLMLTTLMNLLMPLVAPNVTAMTLTWSVNGIAQSMMWPPLVKILTSALDRETYNRATVFVSYGSQSGTIAVYLIAPAFITLSAGWRAIFYFAAACSLVAILVWNVCMNRFESDGIPQPKLKNAAQENSTRTDTTVGIGAVFRTLGAVLILIMVTIVIQGMIRDGITSWMPTFIGETYQLGTSISILSGVILPIFSIIAFEVTSAIHKRWLHNELLCAGVLALFAALCSLLLSYLMEYSAVVAIAFSALIVAAMHGVNLILIMMLPASFSRFGNVSMISGLLNFCTYIGSSISTYGMGKISDTLGWSAVIQLWAIVSAVAAVCCFISVSRWRAFKSDTPQTNESHTNG